MKPIFFFDNLSLPQYDSTEELLRYVMTRNGKYFQPIMVNIKGDWIVLVYKCNEEGKINYSKCTYEEHFDNEEKARHCMMLCRDFMLESGKPGYKTYERMQRNQEIIIDDFDFKWK